MGETVTEKELAKMLKDMDTNNDGKISYPEFEYWWKFGHKGKLKKVVALKFKALKLIHQANEKLTKSNVKLKVEVVSLRNSTQASSARMKFLSVWEMRLLTSKLVYRHV